MNTDNKAVLRYDIIDSSGSNGLIQKKTTLLGQPVYSGLFCSGS